MRSVIVLLLLKHFQLVGAVSTGEELILAATCLRPDVIVCDIFVPETNGPEVRKKLISQGQSIPFVFLSAEGGRTIAAWPRESAVAYVFKGEMFSHLQNAMDGVLKGEHYRSPFYDK